MVTLLTRYVFGLLILCLAVGCSPVPRKYIRDAVPNARLTQMATAPEAYRGKLLLMGAVIHDEQTKDGTLWLHVKNRPLDQDYRPQLPPSIDDPEAGSYWVVVTNPRSFPHAYRHWADMTVVGRFEGLAAGQEPILKMIYVRGWGLSSQHDGVWEEMIDANYVPSSPAGAVGELGPQ